MRDWGNQADHVQWGNQEAIWEIKTKTLEAEFDKSFKNFFVVSDFFFQIFYSRLFTKI